jgi:hypothetical protein
VEAAMNGSVTKRELMDEARLLDIPGRSTMNKAELEAAVQRVRPGRALQSAAHMPSVHYAITEFLRHAFRYLR